MGSDLDMKASLGQAGWSPLCLPPHVCPSAGPIWAWALPALTSPLSGAEDGMRGSQGLLSHLSRHRIPARLFSWGFASLYLTTGSSPGPNLPAPSTLPGEGGASAGKPTLAAGQWGWGWAAPTSLTLAAGGLRAYVGDSLCWPTVQLCLRVLGGCLHWLTAWRLLGWVASTLCPSCQLFSFCGDTG